MVQIKEIKDVDILYKSMKAGYSSNTPLLNIIWYNKFDNNFYRWTGGSIDLIDNINGTSNVSIEEVLFNGISLGVKDYDFKIELLDVRNIIEEYSYVKDVVEKVRSIIKYRRKDKLNKLLNMQEKLEEKVIRINEGMNWFAVRTMNNRENKVRERLIKEVEIANLNTKLGNVLIPTEKTLSIKKGKKINRERVLYPGYIFIETSALGEIERILKGIDGTSGLVRERGGQVNPMKKREVEKILQNQDETDAKEFSDIYAIGEEIEIIDGVFSSFKGKIEKIDNEKEKLSVNVLIFGRPTPVELTFLQIRKV